MAEAFGPKARAAGRLGLQFKSKLQELMSVGLAISMLLPRTSAESSINPMNFLY